MEKEGVKVSSTPHMQAMQGLQTLPHRSHFRIPSSSPFGDHFPDTVRTRRPQPDVRRVS